MLVTFSGMSTEAKDEHHRKAPEPMVLTVAGMETSQASALIEGIVPDGGDRFSSIMPGMMRSPPGP